MPRRLRWRLSWVLLQCMKLARLVDGHATRWSAAIHSSTDMQKVDNVPFVLLCLNLCIWCELFHRKILTTLFCPSTEANSILWKTKGEWPIKRYTTYTKEYFSENKLWEDNGYLVSSRVRRKLLNFKGTVLLLPFSFLRKTGLDNR